MHVLNHNIRGRCHKLHGEEGNTRCFRREKKVHQTNLISTEMLLRTSTTLHRTSFLCSRTWWQEMNKLLLLTCLLKHQSSHLDSSYAFNRYISNKFNHQEKISCFSVCVFVCPSTTKGNVKFRSRGYHAN